MVPAAAAAALRNSLEMQIIRLHPRCAESENLREGPAFCVLTRSFVDSDAGSNSRTTSLGYTKATNSKSQWLNTAKVYFLLTLNAHLLLTRGSVHHSHPGIQADGAAIILKAIGGHDQGKSCGESRTGSSKPHQAVLSSLLTIRCQKQVTWAHPTGKE